MGDEITTGDIDEVAYEGDEAHPEARPEAEPEAELEPQADAAPEPEPEPEVEARRPARPAPALAVAFLPPPEEPVAPPRRREPRAGGDTVSGRPESAGARETGGDATRTGDDTADDTSTGHAGEAGEAGRQAEEGTGTRRRRRGGRGRGAAGAGGDTAGGTEGEPAGESADAGSEAGSEAGSDAGSEPGSEAGEGQTEGPSGTGEESTSARRRKRRRSREGGQSEQGDADTSAAAPSAESEIQGVKGSTRLEARRQRRRDGRGAPRRPPVLSEAEFLSRRESVERVMAVREHDGRTQVAVLEDGVLVEHYVATSGTSSLVGSVFLGRVQNVLPSMEAAFIDVGRGRNGVLYAGEVNWDATGLEGKPRLIQHALAPGQLVLVQVTKEPMGTKGARLTSQISLPGRYVVFVPDGSLTGISRKLPDSERTRLREILARIVPEDAGVIVRTAAEGASEEDLTRDIARLTAQWEAIVKQQAKATGPTLLYEEPDVLLRVVRDLFNEDFAQLVVQGSDAWDHVHGYVSHVAPELVDRLSEYDPGDEEGAGEDLFASLRIQEQIRKALDRKVWLPSGGYLIIDRTEAMTVVDVNTGKFTGAGGNLEETVTRNNIEAAEEIVRQLRLRDVGGIIVIDFIDMVLSGNRDLVMRRLIECLGRDRTRHQVAEVTSLGLVQMTRKRVAAGLVEAFSETCECCKGRGIVIQDEPLVGRGGGGSGAGHSGNGPSRARNGAGPNRVAAATAAARAGTRNQPQETEAAIEPDEAVEPDEAGEPEETGPVADTGSVDEAGPVDDTAPVDEAGPVDEAAEEAAGPTRTRRSRSGRGGRRRPARGASEALSESGSESGSDGQPDGASDGPATRAPGPAEG